MKDDIKCLVVRQPWAWALVAGAKSIENRSWTTGYRGPIVIQAGLPKTIVHQIAKSTSAALPGMVFDYGSLIGVVDLIDISPLDEVLESNPWAWGPYCWKLGNARRFKRAIPAKGKLKLFSLDVVLAEQARLAISVSKVAEPDPYSQEWTNAIVQFGSDEKSRHQELLNNYYDLEDFDGVFRLVERGVAKWGDADALLDRALAKCIVEELKDALDDANRVIETAPNNARAYLIRSYIFDALADHKLAERDRNKVREIDPQYAASRIASKDDASE